MTKFVILLLITATVVATYALTRDPAATAILGSAATIGGLLAWRLVRPTATEVTSDPLPTFIPRTLAERRAEEMKILAAPAIDEDGEILPPTPNMGEFDKPYRGPKYF
jgi:hypothetical protein